MLRAAVATCLAWGVADASSGAGLCESLVGLVDAAHGAAAAQQHYEAIDAAVATTQALLNWTRTAACFAGTSRVSVRYVLNREFECFERELYVSAAGKEQIADDCVDGFASDEVFISVKQDCCLSERTFQEHPQLAKRYRRLLHSKAGSLLRHHVMALHLPFERYQRWLHMDAAQSPMALYLATLPARFDLFVPTWTTAALDAHFRARSSSSSGLAHCTGLYELALQLHREFEMNYAQIAASGVWQADEKAGLAYPAEWFGRDAFAWGWAIERTRTMSLHGVESIAHQGSVLVPVLDLANHAARASPFEHAVVDGRHVISLFAPPETGFRQGDAVIARYVRALPSYKLALLWGFLPPDPAATLSTGKTPVFEAASVQLVRATAVSLDDLFALGAGGSYAESMSRESVRLQYLTLVARSSTLERQFVTLFDFRKQSSWVHDGEPAQWHLSRSEVLHVETSARSAQFVLDLAAVLSPFAPKIDEAVDFTDLNGEILAEGIPGSVFAALTCPQQADIAAYVAGRLDALSPQWGPEDMPPRTAPVAVRKQAALVGALLQEQAAVFKFLSEYARNRTCTNQV